MVCLRTRYFRVNRLLLLMVGLWPYKQSKITRLQLILFQSILLSLVLFQLSSFLTSKCTAQFAIEVFSGVFPIIGFMIKYNMYSLNFNYVKYLLELIQYTCDELKDKSEVAILEEYGKTGKRYINVLAPIGIIGLLIFLSYPFLMIILDIISPTNKPGSLTQLQFVTEYFVDREKYFYLILLHTNIAYCIGYSALLAVGTMNLTYFQLICGMFKISSYRVKKAMMIYTLEISNTRNQQLVQQNISYGVDMHRKAMWIINVYTSKMEIFYFFLIISGIASCSLNLFRIFQLLSSDINIVKLTFPCITLIVFYIYTIIAMNCAQQITDHNDDMFATAYNVKWYMAPLNIQKTILFMLQKGTKPFHVNLGGIFIASLENCTKLMSISMSYFTVLCSM
ncbi:odorant receptor 49b-like [Harpegnathos saltator]|uniref:odorant receptor 49b-like n=1 Tax=Harpegnathos saltator TaxID=610380 RepID=UPI000948EED1|nr:odorant receptor 49b-like [Harpegnathos saltator]